MNVGELKEFLSKFEDDMPVDFGVYEDRYNHNHNKVMRYDLGEAEIIGTDEYHGRPCVNVKIC